MWSIMPVRMGAGFISAVADRAMLRDVLFLPNVRIESHRLKTNTQRNRISRVWWATGLGMERIMDHLAHDLNTDPITFVT